MIDKVEERWNKLKPMVAPCPNCRSKDIHLNRSLSRRFNRYWIECFKCHWCGKSRQTIKWAIKAWNTNYKDVYREILRQAYGD